MASSDRVPIGRVLLGIVLGLVALEVQLRLTEDGRPWKRPFAENGAVLLQRAATTYDPRTRFRFTPGWDGRFYYAGDAKFVEVRANALGFRSPDYPETKAPGVKRVALLGDSMVAGLQVNGDLHVRALLEDVLSGIRPVQVLNFGLPGTGPVTTLEVYREFARRFHLDAVVVGVYTDNDFTDDADTPWRAADGDIVREPFSDAPGDLGKFLKSNSCIVMAAWALGPGRAHAAPATEAARTAVDPATTAAALAGVSEATFAKTLAILDELFAEIEHDQAAPILVLFPDHATFTDDGGWDYARPTTRMLHDRLAANFAERGVTVITGGDLLRRHTERVGREPFAEWKSYLSPAAHQTLADLLTARLEASAAAMR